MGRPRATPTQFEIWQANGRIASIDNPVRLKVLRSLESAPRTLNELVVTTRKSKPTLSSLHLPPLLQAGLVVEQPDPHDGRIKWYRLVGTRLGSSAVDPGELRDAVLGYVQSRGFVPLPPILDLLRLEDLVAAAPKYADGVAERFGQLVGRMLLHKEPAKSAAELNQIFERAGLGQVRWANGALQVTARSADLRRFLTRAAEAALTPSARELVA